MHNMKRLAQLVVIVGLAAVGTSAQAQATRTWVSGVGDDVNPCSRTAPCKTFAGAISKTAAGGEISVLDPGGFGNVTINKSITIDGAGTLASILAAGTTGVVVTAAATDVVILRNLSINGAGGGLRGVRVLSAEAVHLENVNIFGFSGVPGRAIDVNLASGATTSVFLRNCTISNNSATGIVIIPTSGSPIVKMTIEDSSSKGNGGPSQASGIFAGAGARVSIHRSEFSGNTAAGVEAGVTGVVNVMDSVLANNVNGVGANDSSTITIGGTQITGNTSNSFTEVGLGQVISFGDNYFANNGPDSGTLGSIGPR